MPNKSKHIPKRRCIGCMESLPKEELLRIVYGDSPQIDETVNMPGRGIYICKSKECLERAISRKSFQRASKGVLNGKTLDEIVYALEKVIESDLIAKEGTCRKKD